MSNQNLELQNIRDRALLAKDVYNDTNEGKLPNAWHSIKEFKDDVSLREIKLKILINEIQ